MHKISIVIITYNEEARIRPTLESIKWCDEIIVVDSCSTDSTVDICNEYSNCKVYTQPFLGYGLQKKLAVEKASNNWVLSLDADEVVTDDLRKEIESVLSKSIIPDFGFYVPITLIFMGKVFRYGAENKCMHLRFFDKSKGNFDTENVHEAVQIDGATSNLNNEILHYSYIDIHHYLKKLNEYTSIYANDALKRGKKVSRFTSVLRFIFEFFRQYFIKLNFLNGYAGFVWSVFSSSYVFIKLVKLYEKNMFVPFQHNR
jgi:glycosyltransferase involved in cell wall biosynthesis